MRVGLGFADLAAVDQRLDIGVIAGAMDQRTVLHMVDARVAGMHPVALAARRDEEGRQRAVRFLLGGDGGEADNDMRLGHDVLEHRRSVVHFR